MKPHYFDQTTPDLDDFRLAMAKSQGYVPQTCLLGGFTVINEINAGKNPCWGCEGPIEICKGQEKRL